MTGIDQRNPLRKRARCTASINAAGNPRRMRHLIHSAGNVVRAKLTALTSVVRGRMRAAQREGGALLRLQSKRENQISNDQHSMDSTLFRVSLMASLAT